MRNIYISLGTNLGSREQNLLLAIRAIEDRLGTLISKSSIYETSPWGITNQADFLNQVIEIKSQHTPEKVLSTLLAIESEMGRVRAQRWGPRVIDLDLLFYNQEIISRSNLVVPHPGIPERKFVLIPLAEIAPSFMHPVLHKTMKELESECSDASRVVRPESNT